MKRFERAKQPYAKYEWHASALPVRRKINIIILKQRNKTDA